MQYQIKILLLSFVITIITSLAIIPILKKLKIGQIERDDGPASHLKKQGTPTMGGIIMIVAIIIATVGACIFFSVTNNQELIKRLIPLLIIKPIINGINVSKITSPIIKIGVNIEAALYSLTSFNNLLIIFSSLLF